MDLQERPVAHQARDRERELLDHSAPFRDDDAAADLGHPHRARRHVGVVDSQRDDVVSVMGDGRRECAALQPDVGRESESDASGRVVALDHRDLDQVAREVGDDASVLHVRLDDLDARDQLGRDDAHDADLLRPRRDTKRSGLDRGEADRLPDPLGNVELREPGWRPALQHLARREGFEVVEDEDVGLVAGGDGAQAPESVIGGRVDRGHDDRVLGADPVLDRDADHLVDVTLLDDEVGFAVVGAEGAAVGAVLLDERKQVAQVARDRSLAQQDPHPQPAFLERLFERGCLVV